MLSAIKDRGFDLIPFDDPIAFRYAYESQYRSKWDKGQEHRLGGGAAFRRAAVEQAALTICSRRGDNFHVRLAPVVPEAQLPGDCRAGPFVSRRRGRGYQKHDGDQLTERGTKEFVLMHCFGIVPKLHQNAGRTAEGAALPAFRKVRLPDFLVELLAGESDQNAAFETWPLADIISPAGEFLRFLQDEWKIFLAAQPILRFRAGFPLATKTCGPTSTRSSSKARSRPSNRTTRPNLPAWRNDRREARSQGSMPCGGFGHCERSSRPNFRPPTCRTVNGSKPPSGGLNSSCCDGNGTRRWTTPTARLG
jgi:hypothetical protein